MEDRSEVPKKSLFTISVLALLVSGVAQAGTIGNGPPNQSGGSDLNAFLEADNFAVASTTRLNLVTFWALESSPADYVGSIAWAFYSDLAGVPNTAVSSGSATPTGIA